MTNLHAVPSASLFPADSTVARAQQHAHFWRMRVRETLEKLEREARRMFQLEAELSAFAGQYYEAVGAVTERLAMVEEQLSGIALEHDITHAMPDLLASRDVHAARRTELKDRYRTLAKEIHPDRAGITCGIGVRASYMHALNDAYHQGDLAAMLKLEADIVIAQMFDESSIDTQAIEQALRELGRAADTYAEGYRTMLNSPINELMLRAMSARLAGWDWMQAVVKKVERAIEEKERAVIAASIAQIGAWRESVTYAA